MPRDIRVLRAGYFKLLEFVLFNSTTLFPASLGYSCLGLGTEYYRTDLAQERYFSIFTQFSPGIHHPLQWFVISTME